MARVAIIDKKTGACISTAEAAVSEDDMSHGTQSGMDLAMIICADTVQKGDVWNAQTGFAVNANATPTETNLRMAMEKFGLAADAVDEIFKLALSM